MIKQLANMPVEQKKTRQKKKDSYIDVEKQLQNLERQGLSKKSSVVEQDYKNSLVQR